MEKAFEAMKFERRLLWGHKAGVILGVLAYCWGAAAGEYVWTGAADGFWTNAANWTVGGVVAPQPPGQVDLPDGTVGGALGDTARFSQPSANTTIDLDGLHSIKDVAVTGASTPAYAFGTSSSQILHLESDSTIRVDSSVTSMPLFPCGIGIVTDGHTTAFEPTIQNDAAQTLVINKVGYVTKAAGAAGWLETHLTLAGTGSIRLAGTSNNNMGGWSLKPTFKAGGTIYVAADWTALHGLTLSGTTGNVVELENATIALADSWSSLTVSYDTQIVGTGTIRMGSNQRSGVWTDAEINVAGGQTLTLGENVTLTNAKSDAAWHGGAYRTNDGTLVINGSNTMPGPLKMHKGTTRVTSIAQLGGVAAGQDLIVLRGGARLVYAGAGETTARTVVMTNGAAVVEQAGTGPLVVSGDLQTLSGKTGRLTLVNDSGAAATWSGAIPATVAGVTVEGSTGWTLSGANAVTALTISGGSVLCLTGDATSAGAATVSTGNSGVSTLRVLDGETVTLAGLTSGGGTMNVVTEGTGKVVVTGQSGTAPGWIFLNGKNGEYESDGTLVVASYVTTTSIAARGDVVPNDASEMVGITTSGSGGADTLAADSTAVAALVQKSDTPAVIDLAANQTLTAGMLAINEGKAALTIGTADGTGTLAAGSGTFIADNENPSVDLTVRAAANLSAATTLDKRGEGAMRFTGVVAPWNGTLSLNAGEVALANDEQPAPTFALSGTGTLAKEGNAEWILTKPQPDFPGELVLRGGVTRLGNTNLVLGSTAATLTITNGAALDLSGGLTDGTFSAVRFGKRHVRIAGAGPDGRGVIRPEGFDTGSNPETGSTNMNSSLFNGTRITLLDDATIGLGTAGGVRYAFTSSAVIDQQYHTLTITNAGVWEMNATTFTNAGPIVLAPSDNSAINFLMATDTSLGEAETPPITAHANTRITFANGVAAQWRPLNVLSNLTFFNWHWYHPDDSQRNAWAGPINLVNPESQLTLNVYGQSDRTLRLNGQVSGPGGITTSGTGRFFFSHPSNTWTGASTFGMNQWPGFWRFDYAGSLPAYSNATFAAGVAQLRIGAGGEAWPADRLADFLNEATLAGNTVVELDTAEGDARLDFSQRAVTNAMTGSLRNGGTGKLVISGPCAFPGNLSFNSAWTGTVEITGSEAVSISSAKQLTASSDDFPSVLRFRNASDVRIGTDGFSMNGSTFAGGKYGMIKVENSRLVYDDYHVATAGIMLGFNGGTDVMEVSGDDTAVTNMIRLGASSGCGAVYQRGGHVGNIGQDGSHYGVIGFGNLGHGYYELSGGTYAMMGGQRIGFNMQATGILAIHGGEAECIDSPAGNSTALNLGVDNSVGVLYMKGGTLDMGSTQIGICEWNTSHRDGLGVVTLDGADAKLVHPATCSRLGVSEDATAIINLNAGVFETRTISKSLPSAGQTWPGARVYFNMGGGTLKARPDDAKLFETGVGAVDRITAFAGGAVIDTAGADKTLDLPIQAPEGMGVTAVDGTGVVGETFAGSPVVVIENTDGSEGYGATAYADFDSATRKVTGIRVTSPGCNYTSAQAVFRYGKLWITNAVTLAAPPSGGLTKKGAGTLTLNAANTFTGPIAVEQGTLKIGDDGSVQSGSALAIASGGTLDLNGKPYACSSIAQYGGAVVNGTLTLPSSLTVDLADVKAGDKMTFQSGSFAFPANATLTVLNTELLDRAEATYTLLQITGAGSFANLPRLTNDNLGHWRLSLGNGNREIRLAFPRGTLMIFK